MRNIMRNIMKNTHRRFIISQIMSLCNLTIQLLAKEGVPLLGTCPVVGCGLPVARHRDETLLQGFVQFHFFVNLFCETI